jgi:hypothetical protein
MTPHALRKGLASCRPKERSLMISFHKSGGRRQRDASGQSSVSSILSNNCNNLVYSMMGPVFGNVKQHCRIG